MKVVLRNISEKDFKSIIQLSNTIFGNSYITEKELQIYVNSKSNFGIVAFNENTFCGFILYEIIAQKTGLIKSIAVKEDFQGKGIATDLISKAIIQLKETTTQIQAVTWHYPDNHLIKILKKHNFNLVKTIPNYWKEDSLKRNFECKICGKPPCMCSAQIWKR